jgi:N6-L-threonylcarbamoyladenine synthase
MECLIENECPSNQAMRERGGEVFFPRHAFCTDNGAMIAFAGCQRLLAGEESPQAIKVRARWPLGD